MTSPVHRLGGALLVGVLAGFLHGSPAAAQSAAALVQPASQKAPRPSVRFRWADHPTLDLGPLRVAFRGRLQWEVRESEAPIESTYRIGLKRFGVVGDLGGIVEYEVDYELDDPDRWKDVFVNYAQFDAVQVQAGKFKIPFGLDQTTSVTNQDLVYRSLIGFRLAPGRDIGVMVHGRVFGGGILRYEAGYFQHDGYLARARSEARVAGGPTLAGRVGVQPFRLSNSAADDLLVSVAFTGSDIDEGFSSIRASTSLDVEFFDSDFWVKGRRDRRGVEFRWRPGPFSVRSERIRVTDERRSQSVEDTDLSPLVMTGWYVSGTWAVTGENKADGVDRVRRPLFQGGAGAVELAARIEELRFGSAATNDVPSTSPRADVVVGNTYRARTIGVNWHLNRWIKVQFNLIRVTLSDPEQGPLPSQPSYRDRVFRFQFVI